MKPWMDKSQKVGIERKKSCIMILSIDSIADYRCPQMSEMNSNLVSPSGLQTATNQRSPA
jgi:hypothetical protein